MVGVDLSYIIYRVRSESVKRRLHPFTAHLGRWLKFLGGRRRIHWGVPPPIIQLPYQKHKKGRASMRLCRCGPIQDLICSGYSGQFSWVWYLLPLVLTLCRYLRPCRSHICWCSLHSCWCSIQGSLSSVWFLSWNTSLKFSLRRRFPCHSPNEDQGFHIWSFCYGYLRDLRYRLWCSRQFVYFPWWFSLVIAWLWVTVFLT